MDLSVDDLCRFLVETNPKWTGKLVREAPIVKKKGNFRLGAS